MSFEMLELWLVRHGESEGNLRGDGSDTPLSPRGQQQAARLRARLEDYPFDLVCSSDLIRCRETAALALPGREVQLDPRLREREEEAPHAAIELSALSPEALAALLQPAHEAPQVESAAEFRARVERWFSSLPREGRVIAFTHQLLIRELLARRVWAGIARLPVEIGNASLTRLQFDHEGPRILGINDLGHL